MLRRAHRMPSGPIGYGPFQAAVVVQCAPRGRRRQPRGASGGALRSVSVEERRDRHETERRYERGVVDLTDRSGAAVSGTMYDRIESDQVLRRAKGVLDIRVRTAAGIDVQNGYPAAWRIRCPVLLDQLRIEKEHGGIRVAAA